MAVEDHPSFPSWKAALENLIEASERRRTASADKLELAELDYEKALKAYSSIADEV